MCISSNSVNQAQDLISVTKFEDFPNSLLPNIYSPPPPPMASILRVQWREPHTVMGTSSVVEVTWIEVLLSPFTTSSQL